MRRAVTLVAAAALLVAMAGCSSPASSSNSYYLAPAVLGTTSSGESLDTTVVPQSGVGNSTFPRAAFAGKPGVGQIAVASGPTAISRDRAIELARPSASGNSPTVQLRSAIHVTLPAAFVAAVSTGARTKITSAWMVTYTGLPPSRKASSMPGSSAPSDRTVALDADTGAVIATAEYPAQ